MFEFHKTDTGAAAPWEYLPAAAGTYEVGQLLNVADGKLTAVDAAQTTTPPYLCMGNKTLADGEILPVVRVSDDAIYMTKLSAEAAAAKVGTKLQVSAGGKEADAAAEGTFEVTALEGTAAGDTVYGRFHI